MQPGPAAAAKIICDTCSLNAGPTRVSDLLVEIIIAQSWQADLSVAAEFAERWKSTVLTRLRAELTELAKSGRPAKFSFNSSSDDIIQGACFIEPLDSMQLIESKRRRLNYYDYHSNLVKLTPNQFECLCGKIIELLGVKEPIVTRASADEGIDFYGKLELGGFLYPNDLSPTIQKQMDIWLVGQAKHYQATQSGTPELRELVGAIELGRAKVFGSKISPLLEMEIRVVDPVFAIFITTGTISANGWTLLKRSGVVGFDGEMVAAFLADRGAGMSGAVFCEKDFFDWISRA